MRALLFSFVLALGCGSSDETAQTPLGDASVDTTIEAAVDAGCNATTCSGPGRACRGGACVDDCRPSSANPCAAGASCDFRDGACKPATSECFIPLSLDDCGSVTCGPGTMCDGKGTCVLPGNGCTDLACDESGAKKLCWATGCPCERPAPRCAVAPLDKLNQPEFVGSPVNGRDDEGAFDLDFDDLCTAYAVTMISGPDYLRQLTADGTLTTWQSVTNLNMGEVAALRVPSGEFKELGDIAATYICCKACGCVETGTDGRLGVIRLDRASKDRPLPNVLPATATEGTGPFGDPALDTGPYGLTWAADKSLYVANVDANGDVVRADLVAKTTTKVTTFPARVTAMAIYDLRRLLVATVGGTVSLLETATGTHTVWAELGKDVTSLVRDKFSGRVYAELRSLDIVSIAADGKSFEKFQTAPRLGRIAIAPDNQLYHLSVYPKVQWKSTKDAIVRWPLPAKR